MNVLETKEAVTHLTPDELKEFQEWFEEYTAELWDKQIEQDVNSGKFDGVAERVNAEYKAGRCTPL